MFLVKQYLLQLLTADYYLSLKFYYLKIVSIKFPDIGMASANILETTRGYAIVRKKKLRFRRMGEINQWQPYSVKK